jgi:CubicO group peptidase (beta-lactamase class C family)
MKPSTRTAPRSLAAGTLLLLAACAPSVGAPAGATPAPAAVATSTTLGTVGEGRVVHPSMRGVDSLLSASYGPSGPGAAVIVARGDSILLRNAYGLANIELEVPLTPEHVFRVGSITKQFTAVATLLLVDEGRIALDDEITRFFPDWPTHGYRITVEHLLTHTSGIRSYTSIPEFANLQRRDHSLDELIATFRDQPMDFAPGTEFNYNNSGYILLGAIIEQQSGQSYAEFIRTRLFEPLGMMDTRYEEVEPLLSRRAAGYMPTPSGQMRNAPYLSMTIPHAAGSVVSTVDDLLRWHRAVAAGRLLSSSTWARAMEPFRLGDGRSSGYGHGWFVGSTGAHRTVEHGGDINGFSTEGIWVPDLDLHVIVLSNVTRNFANPTVPALAAVQRLTGEESFASGPSPALDDYVGVYRISDADHRVVDREGDALVSVRNAGAPQRMRHLHGDIFAYVEGGSRVSFARGGDGRVVSMLVRPRLGPEPRPAPRVSEVPDLAAAEPPPAEVAPELLDAYVGDFQLAPGFVIAIRRTAEGINLQATGQPVVTLVARSTTRFAIQGIAAAIEFQSGPDGAVDTLILDQGGRRLEATRVP